MNVFRRVIAVVYFVEVGLLLLIVPWTGFLQRNYFVEHWPLVKAAVENGAVRGAISGLGLINLAAGLAELVGLFIDWRADRGGTPGGET